ncbi:AaceriAER419Wp [[Ashbya] aceris (nom. inval.)]|nr:AaceriAER419Wp [[Ashbya] aceris (nom. inval.)]
MGAGQESEEQQRRRHEQLFRRLDLDGTGRVDLATLQRAFEREGHPLRDSAEAVAAVFAALDGDRDAVVDFADFQRYLGEAERQILRGWEQLDADADGRVGAAELQSYVGGEAGRFLEWAFPRARGGYITYEQFRDLLLLTPRQAGSRLRTAYSYYASEDLSSEGDMTLTNDFVRGFGFFLAGGFAGVVSRTCTAPFDRIKVFLIARTDLSSPLLHTPAQLLHHNPRADPAKIQSPLVKAAKSLYRQGGLRAFYLGNGLNVIKVFPESAMKFGSFELAKRVMARLEGRGETEELSRLSTYVAGGLGGIMAQFSVYPIDTLKFRIQCAPLDTRSRGLPLLIQTAKDMYREGGLRLFYRGLGVGILGVFPYAALDLGTFSALKRWYISSRAKALGISETDVVMSNFVVLPMGAFSGTVGATVVYPINLLRTRLQAQGTYAHPHRYDGFQDVFRKTVQREGLPGLYKGLVPTLAKVCPAVAISYLCYENLKRAMHLE